jgi:hypothetical protein
MARRFARFNERRDFPVFWWDTLYDSILKYYFDPTHNEEEKETEAGNFC